MRSVNRSGAWLRLTLPALAFGMTLTACQTIQPTVTDTSCQAFREITYSATRDTPETVREVRGHNAAWRALCKTG